ncbi:hypothetical protein AWV63_09385 [Micromonospora rifamycinica]|nr:hypothetical protein AWV63_09385 [Micromonospora rifamycinica]
MAPSDDGGTGSAEGGPPGTSSWMVSSPPIVGLPGKCLDVRNAATADGQAVHLWTCLSAANQKWTLP